MRRMGRRSTYERVLMDVVMPQMGESVAEGTIVRWIKKVGEKVDRDEPLFEISTDKVDAEIPSPAAGILSEILAQEGETVPVNSIVAVIGGASDVVAPPVTQPSAPVSAPTRPTAAPAPAESSTVPASTTTERITRERTSPLVRQLAKEHNVDITQVRGTGIGGRVTKDDVLAFVAGGHNGHTKEVAVATHLPDDRVEKMSVMRKKIAEHMVASRRTSAHVHTAFEVDLSRIAAVRQQKKTRYLSFIVKAVAESLKAFPILNASIDGDNVVYHKQINIGVAVALETGLIVPVIKQADHLDLDEIGQNVADLAARARSKHLSPDDVAGG